MDQLIEAYTVGDDREPDVQLAPYDIRASMAHARMLGETGLLEADELQGIQHVLSNLLAQAEQGLFHIEPEFEDVHSKIEYVLTQELGDPGKKIHTARSRNDQVLVALHLYTKSELESIDREIRDLCSVLLQRADEHSEHLLPGYTHLQIAMPSSFGLWFSAYAESLIDDLHCVEAAYGIADQNPLGSAAGYGSSFPIDREMTTRDLGFSTLKYNVVAAQMSRGRLEKTTAFAMASIAGTLGKMAQDVCLYMCQNFGFLKLPPAFTTGSSIMPHKQNPDVFEILRGKCNQLQALPNEMMMLTTNLNSGYHRDLQLLKLSFMNGIRETHDNLRMAIHTMQQIEVNPDVLDDPMYNPIYSVEEVNKRVMQGMTFRDAYRVLGQEIQAGVYNPEKKIDHQHAGSIGNLCLDEIREKLDATGIAKQFGV